MSQVTVSTGAPSRKRKLPSTSLARSKRVKGPTAVSVNRIPRTLLGFPKTQRCRLRWSYLSDFNITSGGQPTVVNIRANGASDPNADIGGNQPRGFTEWSAFYNKYTVLASTCHMRLLDKDTGTSTTGTVTGLYGVALRDTTALLPSATAPIEDDNSKYGAFDSWHPNHMITNSVNVAKYFTVKDILDDDTLSGVTGLLLSTVPAKQLYWKCWATQSPASGAVTQPFQVEILVTYDVVFTDPRDLPVS